LTDRFNQGGEVGYVIAVLGVIGFAVAIWRFVVLGAVNTKVKAQIAAKSANTNNPLGRVLKVYEENKGVDVETLELKMDEAIMKETPALETGLVFIKIVSAVAPLLGLLGTVTGMIATFQSITMFGAGDPKLMAGGISQALVTTVLGLVVAIPTLLLHSFVAGISKSIIHVLEEQGAGIIAGHAEKESGNGGRS
jgi:biopolymer transport protein ExbB